MLTFNTEDFEKMDKRYRAKLINSLSGAKSANLIGTKSRDGQTNLSIVSSAVHIGSSPALMAIIFRPATVPRHTFENILDTKTFSLNHVSEEFFKKAHQTSARYPREVSEFDAVGLTEEYVEDFFCPFVKESALKILMELKEVHHLQINKTEMIIGEVKWVGAPKECLREDGHIDISMIGTMSVTGLDSYHALEKGVRLSYAKPDQELKTLGRDGLT